MAITVGELAALEAALRDRPDGVSMRDLAGEGAPETKRRSIQRRLNKLIAMGVARSEGERRWTRYFAAEVSTPPTPPPTTQPSRQALALETGVAIPLSPEGAEIRRLVRRPENEREHVTYVRKFLSSYQPNVSAYLPPTLVAHLNKIGTVETQTQPAGTYARHILDRLLIDLSFSSSKLEGNTYSILDTQNLIEQGNVAEGKSAEETAMIVNHKNAIEFLVESAGEIGFNRYTLLNLHSMLADGLLDADATGRLRTRIVGITNTVFTPLNNPQVIEECFNELLAKAAAIENPFEQSFFVTIHLPYLQPFADVNKRVSRLAANIPFIKGNFAPVSFIDIEKEFYIESMLGVYELNRIELARDMFAWAYERSARRYAAIQQSFGAPDAFRLRYRDKIREIVGNVIRLNMPRVAASANIRLFAHENVSEVDRKQFVEATETELIGLHEGNFARYKVTPREFYTWKGAWGS